MIKTDSGKKTIDNWWKRQEMIANKDISLGYVEITND